jgi:hypothetical protein
MQRIPINWSRTAHGNTWYISCDLMYKVNIQVYITGKNRYLSSDTAEPFDSWARAGVNSVVLLKCKIFFVKGTMDSPLKENIDNSNNEDTY